MTISDIFGSIRRAVVPSRRSTVAVDEVSREEVIQTIDRLARSRVGMSAGQLLSAHRAGKLPHRANISDLIAYSDLLSPNDPIFVETAAEAPREARYALR